MPPIRTTSRVGIASAALLTLAMSGCYKDGGSGFSTDTHVYTSTSWRPQTVTVVDTRSGDAMWSQEIPVRRKLVIKFLKNKGVDGDFTPDLMQWAIVDIKKTSASFKNATPVPPSTCRRLDVELRPAPELPADMTFAEADQPAIRFVEEGPNGGR